MREPTFFILLSLASGPKHGYAIIKDIQELSRGKVLLSSGTLYEALSRLLEQGWIERVDDHDPTPHPGRTRKAYRLTHQGTLVLEAETNRMKALLLAASKRLGGESP